MKEEKFDMLVPEWIILTMVFGFITWLVLERLPDGRGQEVLAVGNCLAYLARLCVLYHQEIEWDTLSRFVFVAGVASAIITWLVRGVRKPSHVPITASMRRTEERKTRT